MFQVVYDPKAPRQIAGCETMPRTAIGNAVKEAVSGWSAKMGGTGVELRSYLVTYEDARHPLGTEALFRVDGPSTLLEAVSAAVLSAIEQHRGSPATEAEIAIVDGWV